MAAGLVERLDDAMNPIVVKELRQAVQSRFVVMALMIFLMLQLLVSGIFVLSRLERRPGEMLEYAVGREIFMALNGIMLGTCMLFIPLYAGIRLAAERSDTNVDLLFATALKPRAIIRGKLLAAVVLLLLIFSACAPFLAFTYLLRGIDMPTILIVLVVDFLAVVGGTQMAMFVAVVPAPRAAKAILGLISLGTLFTIFMGAISAGVFLVQFGIGVPLTSIEFWGPAALLGFLIAAGIGLVFVWSVAIVNPPSANRMLPVRLYVLAVWLLTGPMFGYWSHYLKEEEPFLVWIVGAVLLLCLQLTISINERDQWAPRVARTIPRRWWLRPIPFLLYSGSAGGVLFSALGIAATLLIGRWVFAHFSAWSLRHHVDVVETMCMLALYVWAYSLTAVLVRPWLSPSLRPMHNWIVMAVLVAVCSALPFVAAMMIYYDKLHAVREHYWLIANPFAAIADELNRPAYMTFVGWWAGVVTVLAIPWFVRQMQRFRPYA